MTVDKVRENRARRAAERQGLRVVKSRRRDPRALDFETYMLVDADTGRQASAGHLSLAELEEILADGPAA
jgi:hypothetical protein